jgi:hypothetical protein
MGAVWTCRDATCGRTIDTKTEICPKCGGPTRRVGEAPWRGWVLILCGLILIGMMGAILAAIGGDLREAASTGASDGFTGTAEQARMILYLFYVIIAFGVLSFVNGIYQLVTGAQHKIFIVLTLVMVAVLFFVVYLAMRDMK